MLMKFNLYYGEREHQCCTTVFVRHVSTMTRARYLVDTCPTLLSISYDTRCVSYDTIDMVRQWYEQDAFVRYNRYGKTTIWARRLYRGRLVIIWYAICIIRYLMHITYDMWYDTIHSKFVLSNMLSLNFNWVFWLSSASFLGFEC